LTGKGLWEGSVDEIGFAGRTVWGSRRPEKFGPGAFEFGAKMEKSRKKIGIGEARTGHPYPQKTAGR